MSLARASFGSGSSLLRSCLSSLRPTGIVAAPSLTRTYAVESKKSLEQRALLGDKALYKTYKPITNGIRHLKRPIYNHLWPGRPLKLLTVAQRKNGGRNNTGRIVVRHRGGGHRRRIRLLDFHRTQPGEHDVVRIEYDPGRSAHIALLMSRDPKVAGPERFSYIIAPDGVRAGDVVESFRQGIPAGLVPGYVDRQTPLVYASTSSGPRSVDAKIDTVKLLEESRATLIQGLLRQRTVRTGNCLPIRLIPPGTVIHAISLKRDGPARLVRAAGTYGMLMSHESKGKYAQVRLQSGEVRLVSNECVATVGKVSNAVRTGRVLGKAGRKRWLGFRPAVRGVAMNKVDHPHGGGRGKSKSNKIPRSPWGWITKGKRTRKPLPKGPRGGNKWVVKERPRGKDKRTQKEDE